MDAQLYDLDAIRSARSFRIHTDENSLWLKTWAGSATIPMRATLFWAAYMRGMLSSHVALMSAVCSPCSKPVKVEANPSPWRSSNG